jgi:hypothetical protein
LGTEQFETLIILTSLNHSLFKPLDTQDKFYRLAISDYYLHRNFSIISNYTTMSVKPLLFSLVALAALLFLFVIIQTGLISIGTSAGHPNDLLITTASIISGVLATNFGAVLGFTVKPATGESVEKSLHPKILGVRPSIAAKKENEKPEFAQYLQVIAAYFYVGCLLIAAIFYFIKSEGAMPFIYNLTNTLLGVAIGALTVALGK